MNDLVKQLSRYNQFYIIGTSTDVGKTHVGCYILDKLLKINSDFRPLKPIETGLEGNDWGPDTISYSDVLEKNEIRFKRSEINFFQLNEPCSPHLSEQLENKRVSAQQVIDFCKRDYPTFIELAGGLRVPLNEEETQLDLISKHPKPIVLVAHAGLGTLNHVLLTLADLDFIPELFVILNFYDESSLIHRTNFEYLRKRFNTFTEA